MRLNLTSYRNLARRVRHIHQELKGIFQPDEGGKYTLTDEAIGAVHAWALWHGISDTDAARQVHAICERSDISNPYFQRWGTSQWSNQHVDIRVMGWNRR